MGFPPLRFFLLAGLFVWVTAGAASASDFVCESNKGRRKHCDVGRRIDDARLVEQLSNAGCREGRSWGHDDRGVWVTDGCRGRFEVAVSPRERIDCNSKEGRRRRCNADFAIERATLVRQKSDAACQKGRSWGFDRDGVWVDRGCRAEFDLVGRPEFGRHTASDDDGDASTVLGAAGALAGLAAIGAIVAGSQSQPEPLPPATPPPTAGPAPTGSSSDLPWLEPAAAPPPAAAPAPSASGETLPWLEPAPAPEPSRPSGFTPPAPGPAIPAAYLGSFRGFDPGAGGALDLQVRADGTAELRSGPVRWEGRYADEALVLGGVRYELRRLDGAIGLRPADGRASEVRFERVAGR